MDGCTVRWPTVIVLQTPLLALLSLLQLPLDLANVLDGLLPLLLPPLLHTLLPLPHLLLQLILVKVLLRAHAQNTNGSVVCEIIIIKIGWRPLFDWHTQTQVHSGKAYSITSLNLILTSKMLPFFRNAIKKRAWINCNLHLQLFRPLSLPLSFSFQRHRFLSLCS